MINEDCACTLNETEFFDPINKQIILDKAQWVDIHPLNNLAVNSPIEFTINGSTDELLDLNNTMLHLRMKIVNAANGANLKTSDLVAPVNNWFHSAFSDVILTLSGTQIEGGNMTYPYKAYLTNLFVNGKGSKETQLKTTGWYKDTADKFNNNGDDNKGFKARNELIKQSNVVEMCGPLMLDFFMQNKYAIHNMDINLKLIPSKATFQTLILTDNAVNGKATDVKVVIEKAILYVRRIKALPSFINEVEEKLNMQNAVYPIQRTEMVTYTIPQGQASHNRESLFRGQMPKLIFIGFIRNDAYNGTYKQNPFYFQNLNITQLALYKEGESIPFRPFTPDFTRNFYAREYASLMQALEIYNKNEDVDLTPDEFENGYTIFGFNLTPDLNVSGHAQTVRDGNIRLEVQFARALEETVNVICMGIFDGRLEITKFRNVIMDWKS